MPNTRRCIPTTTERSAVHGYVERRKGTVRANLKRPMRGGSLRKFVLSTFLLAACEASVAETPDTDTDVFGTSGDDEEQSESSGDGSAEPVAEDEAVAAWVLANCDAARDCGCDPSDAACFEWFGDQGYAPLFADAAEEGLDYDEACMAMRLEGVGMIGCGGTFGPGSADLSGLHSCKLFSGTADLGEPCVALVGSAGDSCLPGQQCVDGACVDATPAGPGEPCELGLIQSCVDELTCDDGVCQARPPEQPPIGEPCTGDPLDCGFEAACGEDGTCGPLLDLGEPCNWPWECGAGLECGSEQVCVKGVPSLCAPFVEPPR